MKKLFAVMVFTIVSMLLAVSAQACSTNPVSAEKSKVEIVLDSTSARAFVIVSVKDADGNSVCDAGIVIMTSRNIHAPEDGWPVSVDRIQTFTGPGTTVFILTTDRPAGTTVYVTANGMPIGNPDGMSFVYEGSHFWNE